jgi:hypothetical protein
VKGLVLHNSHIGNEVQTLNSVRGDANPHLAWGNLYGLMNSNKLNEYYLAQAVWPGIMAKTETTGTLQQSGIVRSGTVQARQESLEFIESLMALRSMTNQQIQTLSSKIERSLSLYFADLRNHFPEGAYLKNFEDFGTADLGTQITTFGSSEKALAKTFVRRFLQALKEGSQNSKWSDSEFQKRISKNIWEMEIIQTNYNPILIF